jgi:hypothetical protein
MQTSYTTRFGSFASVIVKSAGKQVVLASIPLYSEATKSPRPQ